MTSSFRATCLTTRFVLFMFITCLRKQRKRTKPRRRRGQRQSEVRAIGVSAMIVLEYLWRGKELSRACLDFEKEKGRA
jgi:heme/copper-type cytochrome/quinol oxidase subunit 2